MKLNLEMMPIKENMRNMLMALSNGIKDPKMGDMMSKLLDTCLEHHHKIMDKANVKSESCSDMEKQNEQETHKMENHAKGKF